MLEDKCPRWDGVYGGMAIQAILPETKLKA